MCQWMFDWEEVYAINAWKWKNEIIWMVYVSTLLHFVKNGWNFQSQLISLKYMKYLFSI